jgi:hypothetical protein
LKPSCGSALPLSIIAGEASGCEWRGLDQWRPNFDQSLDLGLGSLD